jgi:hypothetical protein
MIIAHIPIDISERLMPEVLVSLLRQSVEVTPLVCVTEGLVQRRENIVTAKNRCRDIFLSMNAPFDSYNNAIRCYKTYEDPDWYPENTKAVRGQFWYRTNAA